MLTIKWILVDNYIYEEYTWSWYYDFLGTERKVYE